MKSERWSYGQDTMRLVERLLGPLTTLNLNHVEVQVLSCAPHAAGLGGDHSVESQASLSSNAGLSAFSRLPLLHRSQQFRRR